MIVAAIIQARVRSSRLLGKVLIDIAGRPMLAHVVERAQKISGVHEVLVATSYYPDDDPVEALATSLGMACVRGSERDVLARYHLAAEIAGADVIVRLTGDCPCLAPDLSSAVVHFYLDNLQVIDGRFDYASNVPELDGTDTEIFSREILERAYREARNPADREHVTSWMRRVKSVRRGHVAIDGPDWIKQTKLSVDTEEDLARVRRIYSYMEPGALDWPATERAVGAANNAVERGEAT